MGWWIRGSDWAISIYVNGQLLYVLYVCIYIFQLCYYFILSKEFDGKASRENAPWGLKLVGVLAFMAITVLVSREPQQFGNAHGGKNKHILRLCDWFDPSVYLGQSGMCTSRTRLDRKTKCSRASTSRSTLALPLLL